MDSSIKSSVKKQNSNLFIKLQIVKSPDHFSESSRDYPGNYRLDSLMVMANRFLKLIETTVKNCQGYKRRVILKKNPWIKKRILRITRKEIKTKAAFIQMCDTITL